MARALAFRPRPPVACVGQELRRLRQQLVPEGAVIQLARPQRAQQVYVLSKPLRSRVAPVGQREAKNVLVILRYDPLAAGRPAFLRRRVGGEEETELLFERPRAGDEVELRNGVGGRLEEPPRDAGGAAAVLAGRPVVQRLQHLRDTVVRGRTDVKGNVKGKK